MSCLMHYLACVFKMKRSIYEVSESCVASLCEIDDAAYTARINEVQERPDRWRNWKVENGMLYKYRHDALLDPICGEREGWKLVVPKNLHERVLHEAHSVKSAAHLGVEKTYDRLARDIFLARHVS
ncbi:unnamed protein product [Trichogramma brassicae]|uniref:Integrase zinc-binding domain-containing protein n=1 Tax=Trichogramma brassicae TaxID=86971 RepID=A0A6H5IT27_9HYME|nr:unnamed protein product [Trichogramma brassicae]